MHLNPHLQHSAGFTVSMFSAVSSLLWLRQVRDVLRFVSAKSSAADGHLKRALRQVLVPDLGWARPYSVMALGITRVQLRLAASKLACLRSNSSLLPVESLVDFRSVQVASLKSPRARSFGPLEKTRAFRMTQFTNYCSEGGYE